MIRDGRVTATIVFLVVGFSVAAMQESPIDGRWEGALTTADGSVTVAYNLKVKGQALTGTGETPAGTQPITEGKVKGNKIFFKTEINGRAIEHQGTVSGDTIQLKNFGPGGEFELKLKRISSEKKSGPQ